MSLVESTAPFLDTRAADLRFSVTEPILPALATKDLGPVTLRVLGASHQVVVTRATGALVETVAYLPHSTTPLPERFEAAHTMRSRVERLDTVALDARVSALVAELSEREDALVVRFPGADSAVTALHAQVSDGRVSWRTWHAYPQHHELVSTWSRCALTSHPGEDHGCHHEL